MRTPTRFHLSEEAQRGRRFFKKPPHVSLSTGYASLFSQRGLEEAPNLFHDLEEMLDLENIYWDNREGKNPVLKRIDSEGDRFDAEFYKEEHPLIYWRPFRPIRVDEPRKWSK